MKRFLLSLLLLASMSASASAMSYTEAREYAYYLTDKMAYELNLTDEQYERCYEVNLDYLMSIDHRHDLYGNYWNFRDMDLRYILFDWQYALYRNVEYFYRPISWHRNSFVFGVYNQYRQRDYYYYSRPRVYVSYSGNNWYNRRYNAPSPYSNMVFSGRRGGMRDEYRAGANYGYSYRNGYNYDQRRNYNDYYEYRNTPNYGNNNWGRNNYSRGNVYNGQSEQQTSKVYRYDNAPQQQRNSYGNSEMIRGNRSNSSSRGGNFGGNVNNYSGNEYRNNNNEYRSNNFGNSLQEYNNSRGSYSTPPQRGNSFDRQPMQQSGNSQRNTGNGIIVGGRR